MARRMHKLIQHAMTWINLTNMISGERSQLKKKKEENRKEKKRKIRTVSCHICKIQNGQN